MEIIHQVIDKEGLNIPLPIIEQYGLHPGGDAVLELEVDGIRIRPAAPDKSQIESMALVYLLANVGDGARVAAERENGNWRVAVFSMMQESPLGYLYYSQDGKLLEHNSISVSELLENK